MAVKDWWDSFNPDDCLKIGSWEDMTNYIQHSACTDFTIYSECTIDGQAFRFTNNGILSMLIGGADSGDDLSIYANDVNLCASIKLFGNGGIVSKIKWDSDFEISTCSDEELLAVNKTALTYKETIKFTVEGILSTLEGGNDAGDDFLVKANSTDDCSWTKWFGNAGVQIAIKAASGFEVSTCSLETLWEVDSSPADKHVDFHCLDAHNFVLELRTTDPSSPTCIGQIWFRTDLV